VEILISVVCIVWLFSFAFGIVTILKAEMPTVGLMSLVIPESSGTDDYLRNAESFMG
jgi:hypothetical protein